MSSELAFRRISSFLGIATNSPEFKFFLRNNSSFFRIIVIFLRSALPYGYASLPINYISQSSTSFGALIHWSKKDQKLLAVDRFSSFIKTIEIFDNLKYYIFSREKVCIPRKVSWLAQYKRVVKAHFYIIKHYILPELKKGSLKRKTQIDA